MIAPLRSDTRANWLAANPVLAVNEAVVESDTGQVRVGNGVDGFAFLPTAGITADAAARLYPNPLVALDSQVAALITAGGEATPAALGAAYVPQLPTTGSLTYNGDGTVATDADGNAYTWNGDGTPATQTKGGVTRTFHWNTDGTLASVS